MTSTTAIDHTCPWSSAPKPTSITQVWLPTPLRCLRKEAYAADSLETELLVEHLKRLRDGHVRACFARGNNK